MPLPAGARIGPYEVIGVIGAGGMGEVYRARDGKLQRDVALKILPDAFAADPDRLARFEREARTLASLNHPHIAQIHGFEQSDGTSALVMELVDGEDLAERLGRGAIPFDEALPLAQQIAEGLEAAHDQGIVHRDLKPANVKVRPDGTVKILDFGLAKLTAAGSTDHASRASALSLSPTITSPAGLTAAGMLLGTAAYMSPEQVKGREADRRSDVWAFGCVLYEMLTARRAFDGEDVSDTLAIVLRGDPDWSSLSATLPPSIATLIRRCLERDPRRRIASMSTVRYLLSEPSAIAVPADARPASPDPTAMQAAIDAAVTRTRSRLTRTRVLPLAAALAAATIVAGTALRNRTPIERPVTRFSVNLGANATAANSRTLLAISDDGSQMAYVSEGRLFHRRFSDVEPRLLIGAGNRDPVNSPVFAPDGRAVAFYAPAAGEVRRMAVNGGGAVTVCAVGGLFGMTWDASGILIGQGANGVMRCPAAGAQPELVASVSEGEEAYGPQMLPDGKTLIFTIAKIADGLSRWDTASIVAQPLPSGERRVLLTGGSDGRYVSTGHLLYALGGSVLAAPFDADRVALTGEPAPVIEGVRRTLSGSTGVAQFVTSMSGTLGYLPGPQNPGTSGLLIATADRSGAVTTLPAPPAPYTHTRASPDGTRLAVGTDDSKEAIVSIVRLDAKAPSQRLTLKGANRFPIWSPDSQRVVYQSDQGGDRGLWLQRVDGVGVPERLTTAGPVEAHIPESWSPDGAHIAVAIVRERRYSLSILSVTDRTLAPFGNVESAQPIGSDFSPDGRWIAYAVAAETGGGQSPNRGVFVQPFPATGQLTQAPKQSLDFHPVWSRDGKELIWIPSAASGRIAVASITTKPTFVFGSITTVPQRVTADRPSGDFRVFDVLPDGRFVGLVFAEEAGTSRVAASDVRVVLNWFEELKQKVPTRP